MMRDLLGDERGMITIVGLSALSVLMFLGAAVYTLTQSNAAAAMRFLRHAELRDAARSGAVRAMSRMNDGDAGGAESASSPVLILNETEGALKCSVYARSKGGEVVLLSVGEKNGERARAVAYLKRLDDRYIVSRWEH